MVASVAHYGTTFGAQMVQPLAHKGINDFLSITKT